MKLAAVHSPTIAPNQSRAPERPWMHLLDRPVEHGSDIGRQSAEDRCDGQRGILGPAEQPSDRGGQDEEGKHREQRQIGEIAGVDETVVVKADPDPLGDDQRLDFALGAFDRRLSEARPQPASRLRRSSGE